MALRISRRLWLLGRPCPSEGGQRAHRHVDEGFCSLRQTLVILTHPPVLIYPRKGPLHDPPTRQHLEALRGIL